MNVEFVEEVKRLMKAKGFKRATFKNGPCTTITFMIPDRCNANLVCFDDGTFEFKYSDFGFAMGVVAVTEKQTLEFIGGIK